MRRLNVLNGPAPTHSRGYIVAEYQRDSNVTPQNTEQIQQLSQPVSPQEQVTLILAIERFLGLRNRLWIILNNLNDLDECYGEQRINRMRNVGRLAHLLDTMLRETEENNQTLYEKAVQYFESNLEDQEGSGYDASPNDAMEIDDAEKTVAKHFGIDNYSTHGVPNDMMDDDYLRTEDLDSMNPDEIRDLLTLNFLIGEGLSPEVAEEKVDFHLEQSKQYGLKMFKALEIGEQELGVQDFGTKDIIAVLQAMQTHEAAPARARLIELLQQIFPSGKYLPETDGKLPSDGQTDLESLAGRYGYTSSVEEFIEKIRKMEKRLIAEVFSMELE